MRCHAHNTHNVVHLNTVRAMIALLFYAHSLQASVDKWLGAVYVSAVGSGYTVGGRVASGGDLSDSRSSA